MCWGCMYWVRVPIRSRSRVRALALALALKQQLLKRVYFQLKCSCQARGQTQQ